MKRILIILSLFASVTTFAQSPRIKLNQITKDTVKGSVLISSPTDSGMVYSRDFYIAYGLTDTVLILYGDTLAATSGIISSVLSDGVTITGDGTTGNELKVDTATVISTIKGLVDTLTNRGYLTANETITLSGDVTGSGTTAITATVVDDSHNHIISNVDNLQDSLTAKANVTELSNYLLTSNYIVDSTRLNTTGDTAYYYQNGVLIGTKAIAGGGGTTYNNISETADTVYIAKYLDVDTSTFYVDATNNRVAIGQTQTLSGAALSLRGGLHIIDPDTTIGTDQNFYIYPKEQTTAGANASEFTFYVAGPGSTSTSDGPYFIMRGKNFSRSSNQRGAMFFSGAQGINSPAGYDGSITFHPQEFIEFATGDSYNIRMKILKNGNVGIGTSTPTQKLSISGTTASNAGIYSSMTNLQSQGFAGLYVEANKGSAPDYAYATFQVLGSDVESIGYTGLNNASRFRTGPGINKLIMATGALKPIIFQTNDTDRMTIEADGEVIVGTTDRGAYNLQCNGTGVWGQGAYVNGSDIKLKTNIESISNSLNKILKLNPVKYNYKSEYTSDTSPQLGFIAQEVVSALDSYADAVVKDNGDILSMAYQNLIPLLTKAIQEQQAIIESQATEIDQLKTLITDLTNRLTILENK